jgi:hypothetical protein
MDEFSDQESEEIEDEAPSGFEALPKATQAEIRKLRKEAEGLRTRLKERDTEVLTAKYGADVVELLPEEVTAYDRRVELAERLASRLSPAPSNETEQHEPAPEEAQAEEPELSGLAAVAKAPSTGKPAPEGLLTVAEIKELGKTDPIRANDLIRQGKFVEQTSW